MGAVVDAVFTNDPRLKAGFCFGVVAAARRRSKSKGHRCPLLGSRRARIVPCAQWRPRGRQAANQMGTGAHLTTAQIAVEADVSELADQRG